MLKAHQACIDLQKHCLRIRDREIPFLSEHELPDKAKTFEQPPEDPTAPPSASQPTRSGAGANFPGAGHTIGTQPAAATSASVSAPRAPQTMASRHSEEAIGTLMGLGVTREVAISTLDAANGNLDIAASLLF
jgi:DNA damage-inducible protein 1